MSKSLDLISVLALIIQMKKKIWNKGHLNLIDIMKKENVILKAVN